MRFVLLACVVVACSAPERRRTDPSTLESPVAPGLRLPDTITPLAYDVMLDIDPDSEIFRGEVAIEVRIERPTDHVWLHADQLTITKARWKRAGAGGALELVELPAEQMRAFRFGRVLPAGADPIRLTFAFSGRMTGDQEGLFRQRRGAWYVFSQGEAVFARRIVPCFDEPRFKTPWRVTLVVPKPHVALSNMPEQATTVLGDNKKRVVFAATPPMPSYLLAVAVGPFELVDAGTVGRGKVPVRVAVRAGEGGRAGVVAAKLPAIVDAIENYLDEALPVVKLDLVAVPVFFGAMENLGLVTFHEQIIVGDPKREAFANYFTLVAAHELAHQWFGNLVTPAWWDHLWLSEAFASWLGDKLVRELRAYDDTPLRVALARREAIDADRERGAKPLWRHVGTTAEADEGFDSIAYAKGQLVLASFEAFIGDAAFRSLVRDYVRTRRGGTVTSDDLIAALASATSTQLGGTLRRFAAGAGTPVVELALRCDGKPMLVARGTGGLVPLCVRYGTGRAASRACALAGDRTELPLGDACPAWVHANPDGGYFHTRWVTHGSLGPAPRIADLDPAARIVAGDDLAAAVARGELTAKEALAQLRALTESSEPYAQLGAVALARAVDPLVDDATRTAWTRWLAARFGERLAVESKPLSPAEREVVDSLLAILPGDAFATGVTRRAYALLDKNLPDAFGELPAGLVSLAAVHGGDKLFDRMAFRARVLRDPDARDSWFASLGEFGAAQLPKALALVTKGDVLPAHAWPAVARYLARGPTRTAAWRAVKAELPAILRRMSAAEATAVIDATAHLCEQIDRDDVAATFAGSVERIAGGHEHLATALAAIDACIARRAKLGDLAAALAAAR